MPRGKKKSAGRAAKDRTHDYIDDGTHDESEDEDLPSDEAGRRKIKKNYEELLGIRIEKLRGRVLNREKINKSIDGLYFICFECKKICHNYAQQLLRRLRQSEGHPQQRGLNLDLKPTQNFHQVTRQCRFDRDDAAVVWMAKYQPAGMQKMALHLERI